MKDNIDNLTILVNSCDKYSDLWYPFFCLLKKNWEGKLPKIQLNTESSTFSFEDLGIENANCNVKEWGERFISAISRVETDYVLIMLDDFFVRKTINVSEIHKCINRLEEDKDIAVFYFNDIDERFSYGFVDSEYDNYVLAKEQINYLYNLQAAIWRKADLIRTVLPQDTPWTWELLRYRFCDIHKKFLFLKKESERVIDYGYNRGAWGVYRGKWVLDDVGPLFKSINYKINYNDRGIYNENGSKITPYKIYI